ncbi:Vps62-related protein [Streptosporangium sp. KLBMP 9127]|nr:Vps62-related protein [Streptosporangium sp. KLBMP 9127]
MITQRYGPLEIGFTTRLQRSWHDGGSGADKNGAFWRPLTEELGGNWRHLGSMGRSHFNNIAGKEGGLVVREAQQGSGALKPPVDFQLIWKDAGSGADADGAVWRPVPPSGYVALGDLWTGSWAKPAAGHMVCVRQDLVRRGDVGSMVWWDKGSGADADVSVWNVQAPPYPGNDDQERIIIAPGLVTAVASYDKPGPTPATWALDLPAAVEKKNGPATPEMTSFEEPPRYTTAVVDRRVVVPYTMVTDNGREEPWKVEHSPFYTLERTRFYTLQTYHDNRRGSQPGQQGVDVQTGVSREESNAYSQKTGMSVTVEAGVAFKAVSASVSTSVSIETGYERRSSITTFSNTTKRQTISTPGGSAGCLWSRTDELTPLRADGAAASGASPLGFNVASYVTGEYPPGSGVELLPERPAASQQGADITEQDSAPVTAPAAG